jgi:hypothetical protein
MPSPDLICVPVLDFGLRFSFMRAQCVVRFSVLWFSLAHFGSVVARSPVSSFFWPVLLAWWSKLLFWLWWIELFAVLLMWNGVARSCSHPRLLVIDLVVVLARFLHFAQVLFAWFDSCFRLCLGVPGSRVSFPGFQLLCPFLVWDFFWSRLRVSEISARVLAYFLVASQGFDSVSPAGFARWFSSSAKLLRPAYSVPSHPSQADFLSLSLNSC